MKVFRDGKEVKNATVHYLANGLPFTVEVEGQILDAKAFEFKDEKPAKKTRQGSQDSEVMTTQDLKTKSK